MNGLRPLFHKLALRKLILLLQSVSFMSDSQESGQNLYRELLHEATFRLIAARRFHDGFSKSNSAPDLEAAILQIRKALELIAYSAIAPDKKQYKAFRAGAKKQPDFTRDYHAGKIFSALSRINKDFYPLALVPAERQPDGSWHFGRRQDGYLTKKNFENVYDRLGKYLHAHNPWSPNKQIQNLANDLPGIIQKAETLLSLHARFIRTPDFQEVWVFKVDSNGGPPELVRAISGGSFVINKS